MPAYPRPTESDLQNGRTAGRAFITGLSTGGPRRTSASLSGIPQQQVTAQSMSDILQGTMSVRGPEDTLLVINKALSGHLDTLYQSGISELSTFSTVEREFVPGVSSGSGSSPDGSGGGDGYVPDPTQPMPGERVAQYAYWAGFRTPTLIDVVGIAKRESRFVPTAHNPNRNTGDNSFGLMQINMIDSLGPARREQFAISKNEDLFDPMINMKSAYVLYQRSGNKLTPWGGYKGNENTYNTNLQEAREYVAKAEQLGYFRTPPGAASGGRGSTDINSSFDGTKDSIEDIIYAHQIIGRHPNNWMVKSSNAARILFEGGTTAGMNEYVTFRSGNKGLLFPSLLNYLYFILENGFILESYLGSIGKKNKMSNPRNPLSFHTWGGAIDIGRVGLASEGRTFQVNSPDSRRIGDKMFNLLSTLPKSQWADEHGWHWKQTYGTAGFRTYVDPSHHHFAFKPERYGTLMSALRKPGPTSTPNLAV